MIIVLKGADFSASNIGTLDTWSVFTTLGTGATYSGSTSVTRDGSFSGTVTIADGYEVGDAGVSVKMGSTDVTSTAVTIDGSTITISIAAVTGTVYISVPTKNTATGEEDTGESLTLDSIAYETLTYRQLFMANNLAPNINGNAYSNYSGGVTYADSAGTTEIIEDNTPAANYVPPYSLYVTGTPSQQAKSSVSDTPTNEYFLAANVKVTDYTKGYCGMIFGSNFDACASSVTEGYEVFTTIGVANSPSGTSTTQLFIGSASSANLTGYINNPVAVKMSIFTTAPSLELLTSLYKKYTSLLANN